MPPSVSDPTWVVPKMITASNAAFSTTSSITTVSVKVLDSNPNRLGLMIYNNSANSVYIQFGTAASSANNMIILIPTFATWTMPGPIIYTGPVAAIRNAGSGILMIMELLA